MESHEEPPSSHLKRRNVLNRPNEFLRVGKELVPEELEELCFEMAADGTQYKSLILRCRFLHMKTPQRAMSEWRLLLEKPPFTEHHATFFRRQQEARVETQPSVPERAASASSIPGIRCAKCKGTDVRFEIVQMRSADEGSTVFCTCAMCHKRWRM